MYVYESEQIYILLSMTNEPRVAHSVRARGSGRGRGRREAAREMLLSGHDNGRSVPAPRLIRSGRRTACAPNNSLGTSTFNVHLPFIKCFIAAFTK